jgi:hypothetical protein
MAAAWLDQLVHKSGVVGLAHRPQFSEPMAPALGVERLPLAQLDLPEASKTVHKSRGTAWTGGGIDIWGPSANGATRSVRRCAKGRRPMTPSPGLTRCLSCCRPL